VDPVCYYIKFYQQILILYCPCSICAVKEILKLCPARMLVTLYKIPSFDSVDDFLQKVASVRGKLKKGGVVDVEAAARIVLHDWNEGMC
jgi:nuclear GTP-binding protein